MKILITGAHFTPAVAVIEELKNIKNVEVLYVGRRTTREGDSSPSVESQVLPKLGVKFIPIITGRLQRAVSLYTVPSLLKIPIGIVQSIFAILKEKPDVVLSFGGYVSVPIVFSAWIFSIPVITHEQTLVTGLANSIGNIFASKITVSYEGKNSDKRVIFTGNPIRKEILEAKREGASEEVRSFVALAKDGKKQIILITGGNQGSHIINLAVKGAFKKLTDKYFVIHQTGDSKFKDFEDLSKNKVDSYLVKKWIDGEDYGYILKNTDLAISRAGANSLQEFAYFGIPTVAIPIPYLYADEQNKNAKFYEEAGLLKRLAQSSLNGESLFKTIEESIEGLEAFEENAKKAKRLVVKDAAKRLALETLLLAKSSS